MPNLWSQPSQALVNRITGQVDFSSRRVRLRAIQSICNVRQAVLQSRRFRSSYFPDALSLQHSHDWRLYADAGETAVWDGHWQRADRLDGT